MHLDLIVRHTAAINQLTERIEVVIEPFQRFCELVCSIPGISTLIADVIVCRDRCRREQIPDRQAPRVLGWHHPRKQRVGRQGEIQRHPTREPLLRGALGAAAMSCARNPRTYLGARYRRISSRRGPQKANVAIQHSILTAIWHMANTGALYDDAGADYFTRINPERARTRAIRQLQAMGYRVTSIPPPEPVTADGTW